MKTRKDTLEVWMIKHGKKGKIFYSDKPDNHITAISSYYKRNIKTERLIAVTTGKSNPEAINIIKIILQ